MDDLVICNMKELKKLLKECLEESIGPIREHLKDPTPEDEIFSIDEAADFLDLSKQTIYTMTSGNRIPYNKTGGKLYFKRSELKLWIESNGKMSVFKSRLARLKKRNNR